MARKLLVLAVSALLVVSGAGARAEEPCSTPASGGEWKSYGRDLANSRHQVEETTISAVAAATLAPAWTFSPESHDADGDFTGTPIVAGGCVFVGSNTGWVFAIDATSGTLVWKTKLDVPASGGLFPNGIPSTLAVSGDIVYANVNRVGSPYVAALDRASGALRWEQVVSEADGASLYASPVVFDGMVFVGVSSPSNDSGGNASGRFALLDATDGHQIRSVSVIPEEDLARGFGGAGLWGTAAIDVTSKYAYVGTGEPDEGALEHAHANAIIKIDLDRERGTFATIVGAYKNNVYADVPGIAAADPHFDFGASPNLFEDPDGRLLVGCLQRAGVYHAVDATTMEAAWTTVVAPTQLLGNAGSTAFDGSAVHGSANPGTIYSLDGASGSYRWASTSADGIRYQPVASANGVVYTVDLKGFLDAYDAATGAPLLHRPMFVGADTGADATSSLGGGVSVAGNTVFAAVGLGLQTGANKGYVIAFRPAAFS